MSPLEDQQRSETNGESSAASASQALSVEGDLITPVAQTKESNSSSDEQENSNEEQKSAIYDYASEKSLSHEESKLFYQHNRGPRHHESDSYPRVSRARTFSLNYKDSRDSGRRWRSGNIYDRMQSREQASDVYQRHAFGRRVADGSVNFDHRNEPRPHQAKAPVVDAPGDGLDIDGASSTVHAEEPILHNAGYHPELQEMSARIQKVLDLRRKYIEASLQAPSDNPKDRPDWEVYPEPPKPVWTEETPSSANPSAAISRVGSNTLFGADHDLAMSRSQASLASVAEEPTRLRPASPPRKQRKPGQDIGSDFDMSYFCPMPGQDSAMDFELDQGSVYQVYESAEALEHKRTWINVPTLRDYYMDLNIVKEVSEDGPIKSFAFRELQILDGKFNLYTLENSYAEIMESKGVPHRDFYNVRKVDTHVHHSACMNSKHLLRFIKSKLKKSASDIVMFRDGKDMTLQDVFDSLDMTAYDLSIDTLDTHVSNFPLPRYAVKRVADIFRRTLILSIDSTNSTSSTTPLDPPDYERYS